ncbi:alpha/beta hydrolase [Kribbella sp. NBC_01245]|uniref:alpha/beta hydrolase n=1 Tax=Kribbella sp. NBC_01245 TaxID=2903578 RepID=UPI002E2CEE27|nr:alpha/beta hydrolase [Kribbella sp. NBC_01245]
MNRRVDTLLRTALDTVQGSALRPVTALPASLRHRLAGAPIQIDGNVLDPDLQLLLRLEGLLPGKSKDRVSVATARANLLTSAKLVAGPQRELHRVTDLTVRGADGQLGARLYVPRSAPMSNGGLLVFFHGGGWVVGDLDSHDAFCRDAAEEAGVRVLSVDYRLAPEAEAPVAAEDAIAAFGWAVEHAEDLGAHPSYVGVGGDSAGGNLAAVVAQQCVRRGLVPPALQVLIYPAVDLVGRRPSRDLFAEGFFLTDDDITWYREHYTPDPAIRADPIVSPLLADDFTGLCPAYIVTAGFDPLRDEGNEYAEKLTAAGVQVEHHCERSMVHGFANILVLADETLHARRRITTAIQSHLRPPT